MKIKSILAVLFLVAVISCKKDSGTTTQTKTSEQLLTQHVWKTDEIRIQLSNNTSTYYKRGASGNTGANYDSDSLKFITSNTGTYYYMGVATPMTWNFTSSDKTKMTVVISYTPAVTIYLENINLTETSFKYAQYSSAGGISYLASATRLPN